LHRTDANNHVTSYGYDSANRLTTISLPPISAPAAFTPVWTYGYDANGNRTTILDPNGATTTTSYDQLNPNTVVSCNDRDFPTSLTELKLHVTASAWSAPLLGTPWAYAPPMYDQNSAPACVQWPVERVSRYSGSYRAAGSAPILVIGTTHDPDTPYQDAVTLSHTFDNAELITFDAQGHTAFGRSACVTTATASYLADLTLPKPGTVCSDEQQPAPVASASAKLATQRSALLEEGQDLIGSAG